jgi:predicted nucleic acid-binding protein
LKVAVFADTGYWIALLRKRDQYRKSAVRWKEWLNEQSARVVTTEAVLWEWLNACSHTSLRGNASQGYRRCHEEKEIEVLSFQSEQMHAAFELYASRVDKTWSLTDCLSFVVMQQLHLTDALTADHHFRQAGFRALLLEEPPPQP